MFSLCRPFNPALTLRGPAFALSFVRTRIPGTLRALEINALLHRTDLPQPARR
jgi:hypothetical protein